MEITTKQSLESIQSMIEYIEAKTKTTDTEKHKLKALKRAETCLRNQLSKENDGNYQMSQEELAFQTYAFMQITRDNLEDLLDMNSKFSLRKAKNLTNQLIKEYDRLLKTVFEQNNMKLNDEIIKLTAHIRNESKVVIK